MIGNGCIEEFEGRKEKFGGGGWIFGFVRAAA